ncbi:hypothetical protein [Streptomyces abikoensis]
MGKSRKVNTATRRRKEVMRFWIFAGMAEFAIVTVLFSVTGSPLSFAAALPPVPVILFKYANGYRSERIQLEKDLRSERNQKVALSLFLGAAAAAALKTWAENRHSPDEDEDHTDM